MRAASWIFRILLLAPWLWTVYRASTGQVGADPAKEMNHFMGEIALYYLALNLLIGAAIAYAVRFPKWLRFLLVNRRWLGVVTFVYLIFHVLLYFTLESFEPQAFEQLLTKTYLTLGLAAFTIFTVLAFTSNDFSVRRLGARRWKNLHRAVYLATAIVTAHVMLIEKADLLFYGVFFLLLWSIQLPRLFRAASRR